MYDDDLNEEDYVDTSDDEEFTSCTVLCCECRSEIYDDIDCCPKCGAYQIVDTRPWSDKPYWQQWNMVFIVVLLIVLTLSAYGLFELLNR